MKYSLVIVSFAFTSMLFAQENITGHIVDETNTAVIGASIYWKNTSTGVTSDMSGKFSIPFQPNSTLTISYVGYQTQFFDFSDKSQNIHIKLEPDTKLEEVVINTKQRNTSRSMSGTTNGFVMNSGELLKAACCNISEAFETNASIDVNYTDAITGTKQIKMLGLTSPYILIAEENIPSVRGASQTYGLSYTPGTWVESIQVTKGAGTVVNGYESISGQINTELIKPATDKPLFINLYASTDERYEANIHLNKKLSDKWSTSLFLHGNTRQGKHDQNNDGFQDMPTGNQVNIMNRWQYNNLEKGWVSFISWRYMKDDKSNGQIGFDKNRDQGTTNLWGSQVDTEKLDLSAKTGYVFPDMPFQSIGLQLSYNYHKQNSFFGLNKYDISQNSIYSNLIFNSIINNTLNKFSTGISFTLDKYREDVFATTIDNNFDRIDNSIGGFFEYTYDNTENFSLIAGLRGDYHNRMGFFVTPRLHVKYNPWENSVLRASIGRGKRLANIFAENQIYFATNRNFILNNTTEGLYGLKPEIAWNYGLSFSQSFYVLGRKADVTLDYYKTDFTNQIVVDVDQSSHAIEFYNLNGQSYANSFQLELNYNLARNLNLRSAYKFYDIQTDQKTGKYEKAFQPKHRFFANIEYETEVTEAGGNWRFDFTYNWLGKQRIPTTSDNDIHNQMTAYSNPYSLMNFQITKVFSKKFEIYVGGENIGNYKQDRVILGNDNPFGKDFDTTMVYAPVFGQMYYAGLRFKLD
ncbi:MAG: TonB-dependent receptor [Flavobacteriaceae bacterium]|jgi:outer membrane receptor for ferrienterochelin and colicin|nr:TonB-dependent receptor [Flavobacteriaceae bacterium]